MGGVSGIAEKITGEQLTPFDVKTACVIRAVFLNALDYSLTQSTLTSLLSCDQ